MISRRSRRSWRPRARRRCRGRAEDRSLERSLPDRCWFLGLDPGVPQERVDEFDDARSRDDDEDRRQDPEDQREEKLHWDLDGHLLCPLTAADAQLLRLRT